MSTGPHGWPARYPDDPQGIGEVPGYEFEVPPLAARWNRHDDLAGSAKPLSQFRQPAQQQPPAPSMPARAGSAVLAALRARNWVTGLAFPILAAVAVGIAAVVIVGAGGSGSAAPSALAAGFPPARLAGADFTGATATSPVVLDAIAASAASEVVAGSANGRPALWVSADGGSAWSRAPLTGAAVLTMAGGGELAGVAHGAAGWLAVGTTLGRKAGPVVAGSPDGRSWTVAAGASALPGSGFGTVAAAVAAGTAGYVIVGHQRMAGAAQAAAWYSTGRTDWRRAVVTQASGQQISAVTATAQGFTAVGSAGVNPVVWLSATGRTWQPKTLPLPDGAVRAALTYAAAVGPAVVTAGTQVSAAGESSPFAEFSADAGVTWRQARLPVPAAGMAVTALTAAGGGFIATGTYGGAGGEDVAVWTRSSSAPADSAWAVVTPQGTGLAGAGTQVITALTADGVTLTGVGFTAAFGTRNPTLWQSPLRD